MLSVSAFKNRTLRILASGVLCTSLLVVSGCYGRFPATSAVYDWNGEATDNHIVNSVIMVGLAILPVYGLCMLVDAVVLNSLEYWSDEYPPPGGYVSVELEDGTMMALAPSENGKDMVLTVSRDGETISTRTYQRVDATHTNILDDKGLIVSVIERQENGDLLVRDDAGELLTTYTAADIASLANRQQMVAMQ